MDHSYANVHNFKDTNLLIVGERDSIGVAMDYLELRSLFTIVQGGL